MDGDITSLSSSSSLSAAASEKDSSPKKDNSIHQSQKEDKPAEESW